MNNRSLIYFGYRSFQDHKRGVENVIDFQSKSVVDCSIYYIHWGLENRIYKCSKFISISIKNNFFWPFLLNYFVFKIWYKSFNTFIHSHNFLFTLLCTKRTNIFTVHDGIYYLKACNKSRFLYLFFLIEQITYLRSQVVHFISIFSKKQSLFRGKNFIIISNTSIFENSKITSDTINKSNYILIVRSIEKRANIDLIIDVASKIKDSKIKFIIAGKGPLLEYYKDVIVKKNVSNIIFLGYVSDSQLIKLYVDAKFCILPALYGEGFGLPIIESYYFDKPIFGSNVCAIPEVLINGEFLFNSADELLFKIENVDNIVSKYNFRIFYDLNFSNSVIFNKYKYLYSKFEIC